MSELTVASQIFSFKKNDEVVSCIDALYKIDFNIFGLAVK